MSTFLLYYIACHLIVPVVYPPQRKWLVLHANFFMEQVSSSEDPSIIISEKMIIDIVVPSILKVFDYLSSDIKFVIAVWCEFPWPHSVIVITSCYFMWLFPNTCPRFGLAWCSLKFWNLKLRNWCNIEPRGFMKKVLTFPPSLYGYNQGLQKIKSCVRF